MSNLPPLEEQDHMEPITPENADITIQSAPKAEPTHLNEAVTATMPGPSFGKASTGAYDLVSPTHFAPVIERPKLDVLNSPSKETGSAFLFPISGSSIKGYESDANTWNNVEQALVA